MFELELKLLRGLPRFRDVDIPKLKLMAMTGERLQLEPGEVLLREGDISDCVYIVLAGEADVTRITNGVPILLSTMAPGAIVGESGVVLDQPRAATLTARSPLTVLRLDASTYLDLIRQVPQLALATIRDLAARLVETSDRYAASLAHGDGHRPGGAEPR
jgi:CRP-like cAMP-binding protein